MERALFFRIMMTDFTLGWGRTSDRQRHMSPCQSMFEGSSSHIHYKPSLEADLSENRAHGIYRIVAGRNRFRGKGEQQDKPVANEKTLLQQDHSAQTLVL